jgi:hypothetical protein
VGDVEDARYHGEVGVDRARLEASGQGGGAVAIDPAAVNLVEGQVSNGGDDVTPQDAALGGHRRRLAAGGCVVGHVLLNELTEERRL